MEDEMEEEMEEAPTSSESKGTFRIKKGHERGTGEGQSYQRQQAEAYVRQTPSPAPGGGKRGLAGLRIWAGRSLRPAAWGWGLWQERGPEAPGEAGEGSGRDFIFRVGRL